MTKRYRGKLETVIEDLDLPNPVIRSYYRHGSVKQYVRDHLDLRTEATSNNVRDFGIPKAIDHLPQLRDAMAAVTDRYLTLQQDILDTFVDRGQLRTLAEPTRLPNGKRIPGLKLRSSAPARAHAGPRPLRAHCGWRYIHDSRSPSRGRCRPRRDHRSVSTGLVALRPVETARQGPRRQSTPLPTLPPVPQGLHDLRHLPEALRTRLRPPHRWPARPSPPIRGSPRTSAINSTASTNAWSRTSTPSCAQLGSRPPHDAHSEHKILVNDRITV